MNKITMRDLPQDLHLLDDEATQNRLAAVRWGQIHHSELPFPFLHVRGHSRANFDLPGRQTHHRKGIHVSSLVVHMKREVENEGNPRSAENSCHEVVFDRLQQDLEAGNSEKQKVVGDFPMLEEYPSGVGMGELDSCEEAGAW